MALRDYQIKYCEQIIAAWYDAASEQMVTQASARSRRLRNQISRELVTYDEYFKWAHRIFHRSSRKV